MVRVTTIAEKYLFIVLTVVFNEVTCYLVHFEGLLVLLILIECVAFAHELLCVVQLIIQICVKISDLFITIRLIDVAC